MSGTAKRPAGLRGFMTALTPGSIASATSTAGCSPESCAAGFLTPAVALFVVAGAGVLSLNVGSDFFPSVDAGLIQLRVRAPARTRIERTEQIFQAIEDNIRAQLPPKDLKLMLDNIGLPARLYNLALHRWQRHRGQ